MDRGACIVAIIGNEKTVADWLEALGVGKQPYRVLLDIKVGEPIRVYVQQFADKAAFEFIPPEFKDAEIIIK